MSDEVMEPLLRYLSHTVQGKVEADSPLLGLLDSMQLLHLVRHLEEHYQVSLGLESLVPENFETAQRVAALVRARLAEASGPQ